MRLYDGFPGEMWIFKNYANSELPDTKLPT